MAEGMDTFSKGPVYGGMMKHFEEMWGDSMTEMPTGVVTEVPFGTTQTWAGMTFEFRCGATSDFPAASILIGGKAYFGEITFYPASGLSPFSPVKYDKILGDWLTLPLRM